MAGRGSKTALSSLLDDLKLEQFQESSDLLDDDRLPIQESLKTSFVAWVDSVAQEVEPRFEWDAAALLMAEEIEKAVHGRAARLMLVPAPRTGKSLLMCLGFVYSLLSYPDRPQILVSASQRLAQNHSKKILQIFKASGGKLHPKSKSVAEWQPAWRHGATQAIIGRSTSCLGLGAAVLWLDDVVGSRTASMSVNVMADVVEAYGSDWISRLQKDASGKGESVVLVNQRLSSSDLAAVLINRAKRGKGSPWTVVDIPIVHPDNPVDIVSRYPDHWKVRQLRGEPGTPTSSRIDMKTVEERQAAMSPAAFKALFLGDTSDDTELCPYKEGYLREIPMADLSPGSICLALDAAITGSGDGSGYAVVASGLYECRGKAIILEAGELQGAVDQLIPAIVELVKKYKVSSVAVEKAGGGHFLMKDLNHGLSNFGVNVEAVSHGGRNKFSRLEQHLGSMALGQVLVPQGAEWLPLLHQQMKAIATRQERARDDVADATCYGLEVVSRWIRGGFTLGTATWGRASFTEKPLCATWGYAGKAYSKDEGQFETPIDQDFPVKAIWD